MSRVPEDSREPIRRMAVLLDRIPPGRRPAAMRSVMLFRPVGTLDEEFAVGELRAAFAEAWERMTSAAVPVEPLRHLVETSGSRHSPVDCSQFMMLTDLEVVEFTVASLIETLAEATNGTGPRNCCPEKVVNDSELQAEYERRYREQLKRRSCPGCGETEIW